MFATKKVERKDPTVDLYPPPEFRHIIMLIKLKNVYVIITGGKK